MQRRTFLNILAGLGAAAAPGLSLAKPRAEPVRVLIAASLLPAFRALLDRWREAAPNSPEVLISFGSSAALARRIELGAPADLFISANRLWMDHLEERSALAPGARRDLLRNRLALAAAPGAATGLISRKEIDGSLDLAQALGPRGRLAIARTRSAPLGLYGRQALTRLGLWDSVSKRLVEARDARGALAYVLSGAAPLGVLYASDLKGNLDTKNAPPRLIGLFPQDSHDPILYPASLTNSAQNNPAARDLLDFLFSTDAMRVFCAHGFAAAA